MDSESKRNLGIVIAIIVGIFVLAKAFDAVRESSYTSGFGDGMNYSE